MERSTKVRLAFVCLTLIGSTAPSIANSQLICSTDPLNGGMAPAVSSAPAYYVGDQMTLAVQSIPGSGLASFYYRYGYGPLEYLGRAGNSVPVSVQLLVAGPQSLIAFPPAGYFGECSLSAYVFSLPTASISSVTGNLYTVSPIAFNGSVSGGAGSNTYLWTFGDGGTSTDRQATHTYNRAGTYEVTFKGIDQFGKESTLATQSITIADNPNVPGQPSLIAAEFAGCTGSAATYTLDWYPTGAQPSNYYAYEFKAASSSTTPITQWLGNNTKIEYGLTSGVSYNVKVRACLSTSLATCGPVRERTFTAANCGGGGGGGRRAF